MLIWKGGKVDRNGITILISEIINLAVKGMLDEDEEWRVG